MLPKSQSVKGEHSQLNCHHHLICCDEFIFRYPSNIVKWHFILIIAERSNVAAPISGDANRWYRFAESTAYHIFLFVYRSVESISQPFTQLYICCQMPGERGTREKPIIDCHFYLIGFSMNNCQRYEFRKMHEIAHTYVCIFAAAIGKRVQWDGNRTHLRHGHADTMCNNLYVHFLCTNS